jgi:CRISPR-associated endoribonuclease Cas6
LGSEAEFYTLSPITVYSTLYTAEGKKKTYYFSPYEQEFSQLVSINLARKYRAYKGEGI